MEIEINYSFIIPHRNVPHLLQRCIDSIPKRDDIQIIIVDDCSLDNTFLELNNFIKRNNLTNIEIYKNNQIVE